MSAETSCFSFLNYACVGGVPTRIIRPTYDESHFRCFAFSDDGTCFATGESNGAVRLWSTPSYTLAAETSVSASVAALSFVSGQNDTVIAVDGDKTLIQFSMPREVRGNGLGGIASVQVHRRMVLESPHGNLTSDSHSFQFSSDGRTLAVVRWRPKLVIDLHRFTSEACPSISLTAGLHAACYPVLSDNGRSLLAHSSRGMRHFAEGKCDVVYVWPELAFDVEDQQLVLLQGSRAVWGQDGDYLLLWTSADASCDLSVYATEEMRLFGNSVRPLARRSFDMDHNNWQAQMLRSQKIESPFRVLLCEERANDERRFLIWDVKNDTTRELSMTMPLEKSIETTTSSADSFSSCLGCETVGAGMVHDRRCHQTLEDAFPQFTASNDGRWISALSLSSHAISTSSAVTRTTVWSSNLPEDVQLDPNRMPPRLVFDRSQRHLVVLGDSAILACAPCFLNRHEGLSSKVSGVARCVDLSAHRARQVLLDYTEVLPSHALAEFAISRLSSGKSFAWFKPFWKESSLPEFPLDAELSKDATLMNFIAEDTEGNRVVYELDARDGGQPREVFSSKTSSTLAASGCLTLKPERVFLYCGTQGDGTCLLCSDGSSHVALFSEPVGREWERMPLKLPRCLSVSQSVDHSRLVLLDAESVWILDLRQRQMVSRISYCLNFIKALNYVHTSSPWHRVADDTGSMTGSGRRISEDGRSVLIGWDTMKNISIVITRPNNRSENEALIRASEAALSEYCTLTPCAQCTCFLDVTAIAKGDIVIGVFSEITRTLVHRVKMMEGLQASPPETCIQIMSRVFYGLSKDGEEFVTFFLAPADQPSAFPLRTHLKVFTPYATTDALPVYESFVTQKNSTCAQSLRRVYEKFGPSVFNAPSGSGLSIFQQAVLDNRKEMTRTIVDIAKEHKFALAVQWGHEDRPENLLQRVLLSHSTSEVREAIKVVSSGQIPVSSAAAVMRDTFVQMSQHYRSLLEHALSRNLLITQACNLRVHESFLLRETGRPRAVYIDTCDSYLDWVNCSSDILERKWRARNEEAIEKMERGGNKSLQWVSLKFVCIKDAAKIGMRGIIRPLLLQNAPEHFFKFDAVKWTIQHKWITIWKARFVKNAIFYTSFLIVFTVYGVNVAASRTLQDAELWRKNVTTSLLCLTTLFGFQMLLEEISQISTFMTDGKTYFKSSMWGVRYFLASKWNLVDLFSCLMLLLFIPIFHVMALFGTGSDECLSAFIAIEAVLAYAKVWYFAQPFRSSGALVLLINNIVKDCFIFLVLAFVILMGFGLALHVLFREVSPDGIDGETVHNAFGTFQRSLETAFYAFLGTVDPEVYRLAGHLSWLTTLTNGVYMMAETVVLLNLLIAIMGDTFDRVKSTEETHLLMGRAAFIDACEAALSDAEKAKIEKELGRYVCVLHALDNAVDDEALPWTGRLDAIQRSMRRGIRESEGHLRVMMGEQDKRMDDRFRRMEASLDQLKQSLKAFTS